MTLVFDQVLPYEREKRRKAANMVENLNLIFSTILMSITTKNSMRIMNINFVFDQVQFSKYMVCFLF